MSIPLFIFPPFKKIFLKYVLSKQSDVSLGNIGVADLLGTRNENDKEHVRLYRALARRIQHLGLGGLRSENHLTLEVPRYHEEHSQNPQQVREIRKRTNAETERGFIAGYVDILFWDRDKGCKPHQDVEGMLDILDRAEEIAIKARQGISTNDDLFRMPWMHLGMRALRQRDEPDEARIERLVSCDIVLFLWVLALLAGQTGFKSVNIDRCIPDKYEDLGKVWFQKLESFAKNARPGEDPQLDGLAPYKTVADFLVSGDPDGGPMETLAEELSAIARGKKRLTKRVVDRHTQLITKALKLHWHDQHNKEAMAEDLGLLLGVHGEVLGLLQYARAVALSEVLRDYPSADIDAAFDAGLACWPKLVKSARM